MTKKNGFCLMRSAYSDDKDCISAFHCFGVIFSPYIPTDEGWLYLVGVMDLCGDKIVGISIDGDMTKDLVMSALKNAICHTKAADSCILHSDRGSQYCSMDYQALAKGEGTSERDPTA